MKVTTLNLNGLRSAERRGFRTWLAKTKPDVLCLQEVRCDEASADPALWKPRGWRVAWHPARKKGYAGTAVWARAALFEKGTDARFTIGCGHPRGVEEGRLVGLHLPDLDVWSLYLPSGGRDDPERQDWKYAYMDHTYAWMERIVRSGRPAIVCGDVNIAHTPRDIKNASGNKKSSGFLPEERAWLDRLVALGWRDLFREVNPDRVAYSWWSNFGNARQNDVGWRIDHIWATPGVRVGTVDIERDADLSDHAPVTAQGIGVA